MGILFVLAIAFPVGWWIASTTRAIARADSAKWWIAFAAVTAAGLLLGWGFENWEYHAGANLRISGFPIPMVFFRLENGEWTDLPMPRSVAWPGVMTNLLAGVAVLLLPFRFVLKKNS